MKPSIFLNKNYREKKQISSKYIYTSLVYVYQDTEIHMTETKQQQSPQSHTSELKEKAGGYWVKSIKFKDWSRRTAEVSKGLSPNNWQNQLLSFTQTQKITLQTGSC